MILPDVNVLVDAFRREADLHDEYAAWLASALVGDEDLALVDAVLTGFVRIVTNPRIFADPAPTPTALAFVRALRTARPARAVTGSGATWDRLDEVAAADRFVRGNLVPDAWLAALAATLGARVATSDAGFARFDGVLWFDPVG
ncbi:MAG: TA system VapC family ribonuclease toxin [Actinomycetota bacterium]